jgi:hypothetical protein
MRAINHALTGALIGLTVTSPLVAIPLAVVSHYICDAIPHYDADLTHLTRTQWLKSRKFRFLLYADAFLCFSLVVVLTAGQHVHWWLAAICAFLAASPDFLSIPLYLRANSSKGLRLGAYNRFNLALQWFQRPIGAVVEITWFAGACVLLGTILR